MISQLFSLSEMPETSSKESYQILAKGYQILIFAIFPRSFRFLSVSKEPFFVQWLLILLVGS
ncbi:hypothetical protein C942_04727 [Photobacterium marinum]|uniref:Uncharacterized protein n=1 Tax=Photobacterium marinum TaxID=1056511 RepID=L8J4C2_9GAMM|nr:hypothetical protein C942_04727 [Photobacterium marinum]